VVVTTVILPSAGSSRSLPQAAKTAMTKSTKADRTAEAGLGILVILSLIKSGKYNQYRAD
jgi:hypothetical protein